MRTNLLYLFFLAIILSFNVQAQTPVMHYEFDNNLTDASSNVYGLTAEGGFVATYQGDHESTALSALTYGGASGHYLQSTYTGISGTNARTVTAWIKTTSNSNQAIVSWGSDTGGELFEVMTKSGELRVKLGNASSTTAFIKKTVNNLVNDGEWHHIAVTVPANGKLSDCVLYVDGGVATIQSTASGATAMNTTISGGVNIGNSIISNNYFRNGAIDDVRIYAAELTAGEILTVSGITVDTPVADFSANKMNPTVEEIITFSDTSTNDPNIWSWDFGDVDSVGDRTAQNPQVSYPTDGTYTVTLTATNAGGADVQTKTDYITVSAGTGSGILQAQFDFDNVITDASSYGRDLMAQGAFAPSYANDHLAGSNSALTASGVYADHLLTGYSGVGADGARTVTAWFNVSGTAREPIISWGKDAGGAMFNVMLDNGVPRVEAGSSSLKTTDSGLTGAWHHIAVTYDLIDGAYLANCKIYIDGSLSANEADSGNSFGSETTAINTDIVTNFLKIGSAVYSTYALDGALDDVRIYSKALTSGEITTVMSGAALAVKDVAFTSDELMVYPTVVSDFINVRSTVKETLEIAIYNILGSVVIRSNSLESEKQINMSGFSNGLYIVKIRAGNKVSSLKLIKD